MHVLVALLVGVLVGVIAYQIPLSGDDPTYLALRQVQHVETTGWVMTTETMTSSTHPLVGLHLFEYILAVLMHLAPEFGYPILVGLAAFVLSLGLAQAAVLVSKSPLAAVVSMIVGPLLPGVLWFSVGRISVLILVLPMVIWICVAFARLLTQESSWLLAIGVGLILLIAVLHPLSLLVMVVAGVTAGIVNLLRMRLSRASTELVFFAAAVIPWSQLVLYKVVLVTHGLSALWQNIPLLLAQDLYASLTVRAALFYVGPLLVVTALAGFLWITFKEDDIPMILFSVVGGISIAFAALSILDWHVGLALAGLVASILASQTLVMIEQWSEQRFSSPQGLIIVVGGCLIVLTSLFAAAPLAQPADPLSPAVISAIDSLPAAARIWVHPLEGNQVVYRTGKPVVSAWPFLLDSGAQDAYESYRTVLRSSSSIAVLEQMSRMHAFYLLISPRAMLDTGLDRPRWLSDTTCFKVLANDGALLVEAKCQVTTE